MAELVTGVRFRSYSDWIGTKRCDECVRATTYPEAILEAWSAECTYLQESASTLGNAHQGRDRLRRCKTTGRNGSNDRLTIG